MTEKPALMMVRRGTMLCPLSPMDSEDVMRLPAGKPLKVKATQPRSLPQHRLYWALLRLVCDNLDQPVDDKSLHKWVKLRLGYSVAIPAKSGHVYVDGSIAFDEMSQAEFRVYFDQAVDLIRREMIPGIGKAQLENEARAMLGEAA